MGRFIDTARSIRGLLVLVAVLLAANLAATLAGGNTATDRSVSVRGLQAGDVLRIDGAQLATTNEQGDTLYIWQLRRYVNNRYAEVDVDRYQYSGPR